MKTAKLLALITIFCFSTALVGCGGAKADKEPEVYKKPGDPEPPINTVNMSEPIKAPPVD